MCDGSTMHINVLSNQSKFYAYRKMEYITKVCHVKRIQIKWGWRLKSYKKLCQKSKLPLTDQLLLLLRRWFNLYGKNSSILVHGCSFSLLGRYLLSSVNFWEFKKPITYMNFLMICVKSTKAFLVRGWEQQYGFKENLI